jgi:hypothetical protein
MTTEKKYIVANPRGIPKGIHIISYGDAKWYEGDDLVPPEGINLQWLLEKGLVKEL